jgi:tripartite-type tricarboxylate transporter receptor subunit TctC
MKPLLIVLAMLVSGNGIAQTWPAKPVRLIFPFAAGGSGDNLARFLGAKMSADLGQPVLIDNKVGAGGSIGTGEVVRAAADGLTLLFSSTGPLTIFPALSPTPTYNPEKDLVAVGEAVSTPAVLVVPANSRFNNVADLVDFARANPGKLNFASAGNGTITHLGAELLKHEARIFMTHIPYRGAAPALTDLIAGTVDLMLTDVPAAVTFIKGGQLKALAVASAARSPALPDVPTTVEAGYKSVLVTTWYGLMAPAHTPPEVVTRLNASLNKALQQADTAAYLKAQGVDAAGGTAAAFGVFIRAESAKWSALARAAGVKLD